MPSQRSLFALRLLPLLLASAGLAACDSSLAADKTGPSSVEDAQQALVQAITVEVDAQDLMSSVHVPGSVRGLESADLYAKVGGFLQSIQVDIGDHVEEGQALALIAVPELEAETRRCVAQVALAHEQVELQVAAVTQSRAALARAQVGEARAQAARGEKQAALALRQSELERWQQLLEQSPAIEQRKLDEARYGREAAAAALALVDADGESAKALSAEARAAVETTQAHERVARAQLPVAEANLAAIQEQMSFAQIKAPFAGVITERNVDPGAFIRPASTNSSAMALLRIQHIERVRISAYLPMDSVAALNRGDRVLFENVATAPGASFAGTITRSAGALGERSRMMRVEVELANPEQADGTRQLQPGAYGDLTVFLEEHPHTPTVPSSAVFSDGGQTYVFVVVDAKAQRRAIEVIYADGIRVGVAGGLSVGEQVISAGVSEISDGQQLQVQPASSGGN